MTLWHYAFVHHALLAGGIVAVVCGCVGPLVVLRRMAFAVHGIAEVGFSGAAAALLVGAAPTLGLLVCTLVAAAAMGVLGERVQERDVAIGATLAFGLGLGALCLSLYARYATEAFSLLFGTIMGIGRGDVVVCAIVGAVALCALVVVYRPLFFASVDPDVAEARGVPLALVSAIFAVILAFAVAEAVQVVGILLLLTLLVSPAAAAEQFTAHPSRVLTLSVVISLVCTLGGITLALYIPWPVGFFVSTLSFAVYLGARLAGPGLAARRRRRLARAGDAGQIRTSPDPGGGPRDDAPAAFRGAGRCGPAEGCAMERPAAREDPFAGLRPTPVPCRGRPQGAGDRAGEPRRRRPAPSRGP